MNSKINPRMNRGVHRVKNIHTHTNERAIANSSIAGAQEIGKETWLEREGKGKANYLCRGPQESASDEPNHNREAV
jgi:hypothetical protein